VPYTYGYVSDGLAGQVGIGKHQKGLRVLFFTTPAECGCPFSFSPFPHMTFIAGYRKGTPYITNGNIPASNWFWQSMSGGVAEAPISSPVFGMSNLALHVSFFILLIHFTQTSPAIFRPVAPTQAQMNKRLSHWHQAPRFPPLAFNR
jgi:hypothetical protein